MKLISTKKLIFACLLVIGLFNTSKAGHLVGGDLSYECLGNDVYRITLNVYRDCFATGQNVATSFDATAAITIYDGGTTLFNNLSVPIANTVAGDILPIVATNPCLILPTDVCVAQGIYTVDVTLPVNTNGYVISYERCCRNQTISNIPNPNTWGATYTIDITPTALNSCNNGPQFNNFPPIVICANEDVNFDHSATDPEGDVLVYSFCSPFHGADNFNPQPGQASAPPYTPVPFNTPAYSPTAPLGGNPTVTIDPNTGLISGVPTAVGQFVVGVCVEEYRNGVLISTTKRDFQFNVEPCQVSLSADIQADVNLSDDEFLILSCGDTIVDFVNTSTQIAFIDGYLWEFEHNGTTITSTQQNPTINFPGYGSYNGLMIINPGSTGCTDTAVVYVNAYPSPTPDFTFAYDSCDIEPVVFTDASSISSGGGPITDWIWDFDDDSTTTERNPSYQFQDAGTFDVQLTVIDNNGCADSMSVPITWAPAPIIDIVPSTFWGCTPQEITFENNSYPINGYQTAWQLGDGFISTDASPTHVYETPGVYTITINITSPLGCISRDTFVDYITVYDAPTPKFATASDSCLYGPVTFVDDSEDGGSDIILWEWLFANGDSLAFDNSDTVVYQYDSAGTYLATLRITDENGCIEETEREINWYPAPVVNVSQPSYEGCAPFDIQIVNTSYPINGYFTLWNLGDGYYSDEASPTHVYEEPGTYTLSLQVISPTGCFEETTFPDLVIANPSPNADFTFTPEEPSNFNPTVDFFDQSENAVKWKWVFNNEDSSILQNPTYTFTDTGWVEVQLIAEHPSGCPDSITKRIDIEPRYTYFLPNALTPNDDGVNDRYRGVGELFGVSDFNMSIWNRWGEEIFQTNDPYESWNGRYKNTGDYVQNGVYICTVTFTGPRGQKIELKEFATVIR